jgi:hypothetical protein
VSDQRRGSGLWALTAPALRAFGSRPTNARLRERVARRLVQRRHGDASRELCGDRARVWGVAVSAGVELELENRRQHQGWRPAARSARRPHVAATRPVEAPCASLRTWLRKTAAPARGWRPEQAKLRFSCGAQKAEETHHRVVRVQARHARRRLGSQLVQLRGGDALVHASCHLLGNHNLPGSCLDAAPTKE